MGAVASAGRCSRPPPPEGDALHALYRGMADDAYLSEEAGRRETARRLLDLIGRHVPAGALLDVGCGHGLLLDEARRRGYEVTGIELSRGAAEYARDVLGLDVREEPIERFAEAQPPASFQAIVLVDVLEHLEDPLGTLDACERLLAPGGALCLVTPDPSSATARAAGRRWWAFVPAHTFLIPRRTQRELLESRGLVISEDVPFVRSFALRYWLAGLAERSGPLARALERLARGGPGGRDVSLSLGDERVLLAHKVEVARPPDPLMRPRGEPDDGARRAARLPRRRDGRAGGALDAGRRPPTARCWWTTPARTTPPRWRCATGSTCCACPPTAATAPTRRPATCARSATAPTPW